MFTSYSIKMADEADDLLAELFIDFDIDEEIVIELESLEMYNEFDSIEIEVPDDIDFDDLQDTEEFQLERLPPGPSSDWMMKEEGRR